MRFKTRSQIRRYHLTPSPPSLPPPKPLNVTFFPDPPPPPPNPSFTPKVPASNDDAWLAQEILTKTRLCMITGTSTAIKLDLWHFHRFQHGEIGATGTSTVQSMKRTRGTSKVFCACRPCWHLSLRHDMYVHDLMRELNLWHFLRFFCTFFCKVGTCRCDTTGTSTTRSTLNQWHFHRLLCSLNGGNFGVGAPLAHRRTYQKTAPVQHRQSSAESQRLVSATPLAPRQPRR